MNFLPISFGRMRVQFFFVFHYIDLHSEGPMVYNSNTSSPILYGIISWGNDCADKDFPGVYAKVSVYRDWINNIT